MVPVESVAAAGMSPNWVKPKRCMRAMEPALSAKMMPQALRNTFPSLIGQYMNVIKNTSLTMAIGLAELSYASRQVETETFKTFQSFGIATLLYVLLVMLVEVGGQWLQRHRLQVRGGL